MAWEGNLSHRSSGGSALAYGQASRASISRADQIFSGSSRDENDEEALKWASLERLPTYDRMRKGLLVSRSTGGYSEIEVGKLGVDGRRLLLQRLVQATDSDNERFLLRLKKRMDRVGIENPTIEVRYQNLNIEANAVVSSRALPTIPNMAYNICEGALKYLHVLPSQNQSKVNILQDVSGIIKPCRLTLLLGPPGSGKSTLLLALAGKVDKQLKLSGEITYNGHGLNEFVPQRTSAYISQHDVHIAEMTVRETLAFSGRCQGVGSRYEMLRELVRREAAENIKPDPDIDLYMKAASLKGQDESVVTDYILKILGLDVCADTFVGDQMLRGISGGQKKRVTTGEILVGPCKALFMDEISTGLDSSTTYQIVNSLRQSVRILGGTTVIALLQPAPETYNLFDDIILLTEGQTVFHGPRQEVLPFFESMGFKCPQKKGVADFLQEVTSRVDQKQYWVGIHDRRDPYRFVSAKEFAEAFRSFHVGRKLEEELETPFDKSKSHPAALTTTKYGVSKKELLRACLDREWLLMRRNFFVYIFRMNKIGICGFIAMTMFLRTKMPKDSVEDGGILMGALFVSLTTVLFNGLAEVAMSVSKFPVFYKQRDLLFYPSWAYALPSWLLKIPVSLMEVFVWVAPTYYVIGYDPYVGRLFKQYLLLFLVHQMASGLFRSIAALTRNMIVSNAIAMFTLTTILTLGGFVLSREDVKKWIIWAYWMLPLMYAQNSISVNEFLGRSWTGSTAHNSTGMSLGKQVLKARGIFTDSYWYWIGVGALAGYVIVLNAIYALALHIFDPIEKNQVALLEDDEDTNSEDQQSSESIDGNKDQRNNENVLPFAPLCITFENVIYSVDMPQEMKAQGVGEDKLRLLKGVSGSFRPGVLTALMGVSGAGKTTLMDVLAGRKTGGYIEGDIRICGYPKKHETFARVAGYCEQTDIHSPNVTVYESLVFSAWLRLPTEVNSDTRKLLVEEVMQLVELDALRDALVGMPGVTGLSTEQRKRLTIAVELVANPSIIFMDEPTSGLDARAAAIVMRTVRKTVDTGRTVVCTIHQPSIDIFEAFDELFLMKRGGEEIYVGPLGPNCADLIKYFEDMEGIGKIEKGYNPATWMLEVTAISQEEAMNVNFAEIYKNSDLYQRNKALIAELSTPPPGSKDLYFATTYSRPFITQFIASLWKLHKSYWRNPTYTGLRFIFTIFLALMFGAVFWGCGTKMRREQDLFNAVGSMYASSFFTGMQYAGSVQPVVAVERVVFYRERAAGMYSALSYAFAQIAIEIPYVLVQASIYVVILYSMIQYEWTAIKFFWFLFFMSFTMLFFTFYGMMAVGLTPNQNISAVVSAASYTVWNLFAGFIIPRPRIPVWWRWYYWACPSAWGLYGLAVSQFGDITREMENGKIVNEFLREYFGFKHDFVGITAAGITGFTVLFAFVFALSIMFLNFHNR
ncbi:hypothetical protein H6P81_012063 [Aristolochia fimbriata]|uniref:ABC transporter domain-containing protein n=1 Tax=Aristolochia fimbriata TaxID=158543 RepID=A0AAV7EAR7_ARIFI|nr:hypothetical protein H6P81_012063 [Aristolochia fimbriata]